MPYCMSRFGIFASVVCLTIIRVRTHSLVGLEEAPHAHVGVDAGPHAGHLLVPGRLRVEAGQGVLVQNNLTLN